jgi:hypothetical protein
MYREEDSRLDHSRSTDRPRRSRPLAPARALDAILPLIGIRLGQQSLRKSSAIQGIVRLAESLCDLVDRCAWQQSSAGTRAQHLDVSLKANHGLGATFTRRASG